VSVNQTAYAGDVQAIIALLAGRRLKINAKLYFVMNEYTCSLNRSTANGTTSVNSSPPDLHENFNGVNNIKCKVHETKKEVHCL
jgi:hypothetical protein